MGKITSVVGLVLIVAAGLLASFSTNYETQIEANKKLCAKYLKSAKDALSSGDKKSASKFAKKAFKLDPDNKELYALLQEINGASNQKSVAQPQEAKKEGNTKAKEPAKPEASEEEEEDGLGC
jgi:Tfp pilus assembly protein PilF